jgi:hypothetical protein
MALYEPGTGMTKDRLYIRHHLYFAARPSQPGFHGKTQRERPPITKRIPCF